MLDMNKPADNKNDKLMEEFSQKAQMAEYIGVMPKNFPAIRILQPEDDTKYYYPGKVSKDTTFEQIDSFLKDYLDENVEATYRSEEIPTTQNKPYTILVAKQWNTIPLNKDKDVLVFISAPWCQHCIKFAPIYEKLATELKDVEGLVLTKMDGTKNEIEGMNIEGYPTFKFYSSKTNKEKNLELEEEPTLEFFKGWIKKNSRAYKKYLRGKAEKNEKTDL